MGISHPCPAQADRRASDHARQYAQLRVAYEAQKRQVVPGTSFGHLSNSHSKASNLTNNSRPGSANNLDRSNPRPPRPASARAAARPRM